MTLDINKQNDYGQTPLHLAYMNKNIDAVELLEKNGARDDIEDCLGNVATYYWPELQSQRLRDQFNKKYSASESSDNSILIDINEQEFSKKCLEKLENIKWAEPLSKKIKDRNEQLDKIKTKLSTTVFHTEYRKLVREREEVLIDIKSFQFEVRFASGHLLGSIKEYETSGVNGKGIDFKIIDKDKNYLVELVCIAESEAVKHATFVDGLCFSTLLQTPNLPVGTKGIDTSPEKQMILVQSKIREKVRKFPLVTDSGNYHIIFVDMRLYLNGGDFSDYTQIALGAKSLHPVNTFYIKKELINKNGKKEIVSEPILGLFEESDDLDKAPEIQKRIHAIVFVAEKEYYDGEIFSKCEFRFNPQLVKSDMDVNNIKAFFKTKIEA